MPDHPILGLVAGRSSRTTCVASNGVCLSAAHLKQNIWNSPRGDAMLGDIIMDSKNISVCSLCNKMETLQITLNGLIGYKACRCVVHILKIQILIHNYETILQIQFKITSGSSKICHNISQLSILGPHTFSNVLVTLPTGNVVSAWKGSLVLFICT